MICVCMCVCGQGVREEAITLKDNMQGMLIKEEIEITNCSKERHAVLEEYRFDFFFFFLIENLKRFKFEGGKLIRGLR